MVKRWVVGVVVALALGSAFLYAAYIPLIGEMQRGLTPAATAAYMAIGAALVFFLAKMLGPLAFDINPVSARAVVGLAVISTTLAFLLFLRGLRLLGSVRTAIVSTIEPFCTALLGASVLGQPLSRTTLAGGALIAAAVIVLQLPAGRRV